MTVGTAVGAGQAVGAHRAMALWLLMVAGLVFAMIMLGGATRLTQSGLSMVHWQFAGVLPPLDEAQWMAEFERYRQFPEYQKINRGMALAEFKTIYWFEYSHRMLGRLIGLAFALPFVWFLIRGQVGWRLAPKLVGLLLLGGLQGLVGWWMVKSGLVDRPDVSHYRLTVHLGLAFAIFAALLWVALDLLWPPPQQARPAGTPMRGWALAVVLLVFGQSLLGGLVAGLNAGLVYNTFPLMNGMLFPPELFHATPWWLNLLENPVTLQFNHRIGALLVTVVVLAGWWRARRLGPDHGTRLAVDALLLALVGQVMLGVLTLIHMVPVVLGVAHQGGAVVLLAASIVVAHRLRRVRIRA